MQLHINNDEDSVFAWLVDEPLDLPAPPGLDWLTDEQLDGCYLLFADLAADPPR